MQQQGLSLIACNSQFKLGEIDLIMREGDCFIFVEVRYRRNDHFGDAAATVNERKQQKIIASAKLWLQSQGVSPDNTACRFDVFAITGQDKQWIINAFGV